MVTIANETKRARSKANTGQRAERKKKPIKKIVVNRPLHNDFNSRLGVLAIVFTISIIAIILGTYMHSTNAAEAEAARRTWTYDGPIIAKRGDILDRNHKQLATSIEALTLAVTPRYLSDQAAFAELVAPLLELTTEEVMALLTQPQDFVTLRRLVEPEVANAYQAIAKKLDEETAINVSKEFKRYYPYGSLASSILGFVGTENVGLEGIEVHYDEQLSGKAGHLIVEQTVDDRSIPGKEAFSEPPKNGYDIVLTIDEHIQHLCEVVAEAFGKENQADSYNIMVMNPHNGEILGMASYPTYDPNEYTTYHPNREDPYPADLRRNRFVTDAFEPGSTAKLITAAAGFEENIVSEYTLYEDPGVLYVAGTPFYNWEAGVNHGYETFKDAMRNSCNVVLGQLGQQLGAERLSAYHKLFGFGEPTGIDFPGESSGIIFDVEDMGPTELITAAFGQGPAVTPIQQIMAVSSIANGGKLIKPQLVTELRKDNTLVETLPLEVLREVASPETMQRMRDLMEYIINAPGSKGASPDYRLAGKTGTANKLNPEMGTYYSDQFICSTIGFAPADDPLYVIYIYADNPTGPNGYYGGQVAAPAFRQVAESLMVLSGIAPQLTGETAQVELPTEIYALNIPNLVGTTPEEAEASLMGLKLKVEIRGKGDLVIAQYPEYKAEVTPAHLVTLYLGTPDAENANLVVVPDFKGKSILEVKSVVSNLGITLKYNGQTGLCYEQKPEAGETLNKGSIISASFR